jgi:hypothetical protein
MAYPFNSGLFQPLNANGDIMPYGRIRFIDSNTHLPYPTYSNPKQTSQNPDLITLDNRGRAWIYLDEGNVDVLFADSQGLEEWIIDDFFNTNGNHEESPSTIPKLNDIGDVYVEDAQTGDTLIFNGTNWVSVTPTVNDTSWGNISGDINTQTDLIALIEENGGGNGNWGNISGDINTQTDLINLIEQKQEAEYVAVTADEATEDFTEVEE